MKVNTSSYYKGSAVVERGPILFSLNIETEWQKLRVRGMTADWEAKPRSAWNYGLEVDKSHMELAHTERGAATRPSIFSLAGSPIRVMVQGKKISQWNDQNGVAGELPLSPASSPEPAEKLTLTPYAGAKLRITVFPVVEEGKIDHE
jgi:hypothetical protein